MEEIKKPYELSFVDFSKSEQKSREFLKLNPKGKVAALVREDGSVLTEFSAVATWLAMTNPEMKLLPLDLEGLVRTFEMQDYIVGTTVHMLSWRMWRRPDAYSDNPEEQLKFQARGKAGVMAGLAVLNAQLAEEDCLVGDFSTADAELYYVEYWASDIAGWTLPTNIQAHFDKIKLRPSVMASRMIGGVE